ncbi:hypothetical protein Forpe1208_v008104 [Fusarium oxysporum f. sp. rapae]|uniref:Uncharacterized protein n=1 Tax=Fusarium oxysporum f. sp. rapae TaxID=485398 RepID=A0A8J5TT67_FUSOX|nr:hypothetical protein Forpe1208_v008104 [Fusarium oxysporum f. sp. rapae]
MLQPSSLTPSTTIAKPGPPSSPDKAATQLEDSHLAREEAQGGNTRSAASPCQSRHQRDEQGRSQRPIQWPPLSSAEQISTTKGKGELDVVRRRKKPYDTTPPNSKTKDELITQAIADVLFTNKGEAEKIIRQLLSRG